MEGECSEKKDEQGGCMLGLLKDRQGGQGVQSRMKEKVTGDKVRVVITPDPNGPVGQCKAFAFTLHQWS